MATLTTGYKMWDSVGLISCCSASDSGLNNPADVVNCGEGWLPRAAQLIPKVQCDTGTIMWKLSDNITEYPTISGARNGIATTNPETGVITVWDVLGTGGQSAALKLLAFLDVCNCTDCEGGLQALEGEYECDYPEIPTNTYCYNVTQTPTDGGALNVTSLALTYNAYLVGYPVQTSYNPTNGATVIRICLNRPIAEIGNVASQTWVLV